MLMNNNQRLTMYKNNSQDYSKFKIYNSFQLSCNLIGNRLQSATFNTPTVMRNADPS